MTVETEPGTLPLGTLMHSAVTLPDNNLPHTRFVGTTKEQHKMLCPGQKTVLSEAPPSVVVCVGELNIHELLHELRG